MLSIKNLEHNYEDLHSQLAIGLVDVYKRQILRFMILVQYLHVDLMFGMETPIITPVFIHLCYKQLKLQKKD